MFSDVLRCSQDARSIDLFWCGLMFKDVFRCSQIFLDVLALFGPFQALFGPFLTSIFSPCRWNFSARFLPGSPLPPSPESRLAQLMVPCQDVLLISDPILFSNGNIAFNNPKDLDDPKVSSQMNESMDIKWSKGIRWPPFIWWSKGNFNWEYGLWSSKSQR